MSITNPWGRALAAAALGWMLAAPAGAFVVTRFLEPGAVGTSFWDINNHGTVVGYSVFGSGPTETTRGFVFDGSTYTPLAGLTGATGSFAGGISDGGVVVGSSLFADGSRTGFIYSGGAYTGFAVAGADTTELRAISPNGRYIAGYFTSASDVGRGFAYDALTGLLTLIGAGGNDFTIAQGVDDAGLVVGSDRIRDDLTGATTEAPGFVFDLATGTRTDYDTAGSIRTSFRAIDAAGVISGWISGAEVAGFTGGPLGRDLLHVDLETFVEGNNDAGFLVGTFTDAAGRTGAFIANPVPLPASLALVLAGLAVLRPTRRR